MLKNRNNILVIFVILLLVANVVVFAIKESGSGSFNFFTSSWVGDTPYALDSKNLVGITVEGRTPDDPVTNESITQLSIIIGQASNGYCLCESSIVKEFLCFSGEYAQCSGSTSCDCKAESNCYEIEKLTTTYTESHCNDANGRLIYTTEFDSDSFAYNACCLQPPPSPPAPNNCIYDCKSSCNVGGGETEVSGDCPSAGDVCCQQSTITCDDALKPTCDSVCSSSTLTNYRAVCDSGVWECEEASSSTCAYNCIGNRCCDPFAGETCPT